jgi:hypothetical protein
LPSRVSPDKPHGQRPTVAQRPRDAHPVCVRTVTGQACEALSSFALNFTIRYTFKTTTRYSNTSSTSFLNLTRDTIRKPRHNPSKTTTTKFDDEPGRVELLSHFGFHQIALEMNPAFYAASSTSSSSDDTACIDPQLLRQGPINTISTSENSLEINGAMIAAGRR